MTNISEPTCDPFQSLPYPQGLSQSLSLEIPFSCFWTLIKQIHTVCALFEFGFCPTFPLHCFDIHTLLHITVFCSFSLWYSISFYLHLFSGYIMFHCKDISILHLSGPLLMNIFRLCPIFWYTNNAAMNNLEFIPFCAYASVTTE